MFLPPQTPLWSQHLSEVCLLCSPMTPSSPLSHSTIPWNCHCCLFVCKPCWGSGHCPIHRCVLREDSKADGIPSQPQHHFTFLLMIPRGYSVQPLSRSHTCLTVSVAGYSAGKSTLPYLRLSSSLLKPSCSYNFPHFVVSGTWKLEVLRNSSPSLSSNDAHD